ncbi:mitotic spindle assembly checkpoint protein MAD2 [Reticulomyxa filosa]|uniref:Mitotic spindle assembly checkpoint protein MAD2 n=1 Tax=Reticulomyxa filosa TaxID=46433 RepID=X6M8Y2_RETFI|nr:mitotic spindle assembly checkpoint protein MAD2 [Reticulomyxa filosa]|eukprot:ETO10448.1 mitotic spindle assembly checkpoint protein MAD2 [Reticulomyxa filosa]
MKGYSINSILFQRGIYPPNEFEPTKKYGLQMMVTKDKQLKEYLQTVLQQLNEWLMTGTVQKLVLVITSMEDEAVLERWSFDIETDKEVIKTGEAKTKDEKEITREIQAIIRQITSSVTFLPILEVPCTFDLLIYTDKDCTVPVKWEESDPRFIKNSEEVRLRSFTTKVQTLNIIRSFFVVLS